MSSSGIRRSRARDCSPLPASWHDAIGDQPHLNDRVLGQRPGIATGFPLSRQCQPSIALAVRASMTRVQDCGRCAASQCDTAGSTSTVSEPCRANWRAKNTKMTTEGKRTRNRSGSLAHSTPEINLRQSALDRRSSDHAMRTFRMAAKRAFRPAVAERPGTGLVNGQPVAVVIAAIQKPGIGNSPLASQLPTCSSPLGANGRPYLATTARGHKQRLGRATPHRTPPAPAIELAAAARTRARSSYSSQIGKTCPKCQNTPAGRRSRLGG